MSSAPSILLLDDGELDRVHLLLKRIGADYVRLRGQQIGRWVDEPRDLLISSGKRTLQMPRVEAMDGARSDRTWLCVHGQDFMPLRARLRELGVHLLVQSSLDEESLRLLILQLLYRGPERRRGLRLPLGGPLRYRVGSELGAGKLAELSSEMCRFLSSEAIPLETAVSVFLAASLGGGEQLELQGHVVRSAECESRSGSAVTSTVLALNDLDPEARAQLEKLVRGEQIGTRVTPLAVRSHAEPATSLQTGLEDEVFEEEPERRHRPRREYGRMVHVLDFRDADAAGAALGQDLSRDGICVVGVPNLAPGTRVTLALHGGQREEPVIIAAEVVRRIDGEDCGAALRFVDITPSQERQVEHLLGGTSQVESLRGPGDGSPVIIARVMEATG